MTEPLSWRAIVTSVWLLGVSQIIGYGTLYYSFAILADDVAADFGWPVASLYAIFSLALLAGGFFAPLAGRWVDRFGAPRVMTLGSLAAAFILAAMAVSPPWGFVVGQIALEIVSALVLYDAAFSALVQVAGADGGRRIAHLTLIGGFASTIFWPLTTALGDTMDWRDVLLVFAGLNLVAAGIHVALPRRRMAVKGRLPADPTLLAAGPPPLGPQRLRQLMVLLTVGFALSGFMLSAILAQMVPMLVAMGLGGSAVLVATLFGPAQVAIRLLQVGFGRGRHPLPVTLAATGFLVAAVLVLAATAPLVAGAVAFAILLGFGSGLTSIVRGTLPLTIFGTGGYAGRLGRMASVRMILAAIAPFAFAFSLETAGPTTTLAIAAALTAAGFACFVLTALVLRDGAPSAATASGKSRIRQAGRHEPPVR